MKKSNSINITSKQDNVLKMTTDNNEVINSKPASVMELKKTFVTRNQETKQQTIEPIINTYLIKEISPKHVPIHKVHDDHQIIARDESIENNIFLINDKKPVTKSKFQNSIKKFESNNSKLHSF